MKSIGTSPAAHKYELGRTVIRREQRIALERIHRAVAQQWTNSMADYLPHGSAFEFEDLTLASLATIQIPESPRAQSMMFTFASDAIEGFLTMNGELAAFLVEQRLALKSTPAGVDAPFTRIETAIAREILRAMLARLGEEYAAAELGKLVDFREGEAIADSLGYAPEENLVLLKFHLTDQPQLCLIVGFGSSITALLSSDQSAHMVEHSGREAIAGAVARLPIEVDVVLGRWRVPIRELMQLRTGDRVVLPDGQESWFAARGVRIGRANVEVMGNRARIEVIRRVK